jgi:ABC-type sugar transport system substrate-binding protein
MSMSNSGGQSSNDGARAGETDITRRSAILRAGKVAGGLAVFPGLLAACGSDDKATSTGAGGATSTATTKPAPLMKNGTTRASFQPYDKSVPPGPKTPLPKKVATNFPAGSAYFDDFSKNVEKAVTDRGFKFSSTQWETDVAQNLAQLSQLQQTGVGAVVAQVQDEKGEAATLQKMIDKGICVVFSVAGPSTLQVIADQYKAGRTQGDQAAKWIKANLGGKAKVVVFNDDKIAEVLIPRGKGRVDGAKSAGPGVEIVANQSIKQLTAEEGNQMARTILQAHPDANVWMADDDTAIGVVSALKAAGKKPGDKIYVSGFNGQRNALEAVKAGGLFRESIGFPNAVYTYAVGQFCCDWIEGKSIPSVMDLNILVGTPDTIDELLAADSDPKSAYQAGVAKYVTLLGNTSYWKPSYTPTGITS